LHKERLQKSYKIEILWQNKKTKINLFAETALQRDL